MAKILLSPDEQRYLADSEYLQKEVSKLEGQKSKLIQENNLASKRISDLIEEQIEIEKKSKDVVFKAKEEAGEIVSLAERKLTAANLKEAEAVEKVLILNEKIKEAENLIKSNDGLQKNLVIQTAELKGKVFELNELAKKIREVADTL